MLCLVCLIQPFIHKQLLRYSSLNQRGGMTNAAIPSITEKAKHFDLAGLTVQLHSAH